MTDSFLAREVDNGKGGTYSAMSPSNPSGVLLAERTGSGTVNPHLYRCAIGKCVPQDETEEGCKARLSRIVAKQKQCYCD
jgi:hypothetical protein